MQWTAMHAGGQAEPELYSRPDGTMYVCGESDSVGVPDDPLSIQPREGACDKLEVRSGPDRPSEGHRVAQKGTSVSWGLP